MSALRENAHSIPDPYAPRTHPGTRARIIFGRSSGAPFRARIRSLDNEASMKRNLSLLASLALAAVALGCAHDRAAVTGSDAPSSVDDVVRHGWLNWRGPNQNGTSEETGLFDAVTVGGENHLWSYELRGRGTPVIVDGRVYGVGYEGEVPAMEEVLYCLDEATGDLLWEHRNTDFLSDVIYSRYSIGSPTIDPATGNVFALTAAGLIHAFTADGEMLWEASMGELYGRLTFPNGRTGAPLILDDLVIVHFIFASWGPKLGPARDRFVAFDKHTGKVAWANVPGGPPKDSSFSMPVLEERDGRTLMYAGLGGGHVTCVDARTGDTVWRFPFSIGGINGSMVLHGDKGIVIHGKENRDSSVIGRMVALDLTAEPDADGNLPASAELWRNDQVAFTSSPVLVGDLVFQTNLTGELVCIDVNTGEELWHEKLASSQLHASPAAADGKLYVPMNNGMFYVIRPSREGAEILDAEQLEGNCLGAPAIANGRVYVHTTERLYAFGTGEGDAPAWPVAERATPGDPVRLQVVPADATIRAGDSIDYEVRRLDAGGHVVDVVPDDQVTLELPGVLANGVSGVGVVKAKVGDLVGTARVRAVKTLPFTMDFSDGKLDQGGDTPFGFPPGDWIGGRMKWQYVEREGEPVMARRIDNPLFQRTMTYVGHPDDSNYTVQVDVLSENKRRSMCEVGVLNQRYQIALRGNFKTLEVTSNAERFKVGVPYDFKPNQWYTLKTRVDHTDDGASVVRAKVWPRGEAEPDAWTLEATDPVGHAHGAAGVYAFTPQSRFTAYLDNLSVTPND